MMQAGGPQAPVPVFHQPTFVLNENGVGNNLLRPSQTLKFTELIQRFPQHRHLMADMCTGSGKTGVGCLAPFALARAAQDNPQALPNGCRRVLWVCPTIEARNGRQPRALRCQQADRKHHSCHCGLRHAPVCFSA